MRDPRSGFAKSFRNRLGIGPLSSCIRWGLGAVLCCACGGGSAQRVPAPAPSASATPTASAPATTQRARDIALSYVAPAECPDVAGYTRHVRARSTSLQFQPAGPERPLDAVDVRIEPAVDTDGWVGRVTIGDSSALEREVRGARCEDVVAALALITVLRLEGSTSSTATAIGGASSSASAAGGPASGATAESTAADRTRAPASPDAAPRSAPDDEQARAASPSALPAPPQPAPPPPPPAESAAAEPAATEPPAPATPPAAATAPTAAVRPPELEASSERSASAAANAESSSDSSAADRDDRASSSDASDEPSDADDAARDSNEPTRPSVPWQWPTIDVGVTAQAGYASVPRHAFKALVQGELRFGDGMSSWASSLSLAYTRGASDAPAAGLDILLVSAELAVCPPAVIDQPSVWLRACAGVRAGRVRVLITPNDPAESPGDVWRPWLAAAPALQLGVPLSKRWALRGAFDVAIVLVRDRFDVSVPASEAGGEARVTLYRAQATSFEFGLGLSYTF